MQNLDLLKTYDFLIDTLIMVCPDYTIVTDDKIEGYLQELEGDFYTFFDYNSLSLLFNGGILNTDQVNEITRLKSMLLGIPANFWNLKSFKEDTKWKDCRFLATKVLNSLGIEKRKV